MPCWSDFCLCMLIERGTLLERGHTERLPFLIGIYSIRFMRSEYELFMRTLTCAFVYAKRKPATWTGMILCFED